MKKMQKAFMWYFVGYAAKKMLQKHKQADLRTSELSKISNQQSAKSSVQDMLMAKAKDMAMQKWNQTVLRADERMKQAQLNS